VSILEALLLGIIQGATEFLPVSSSGHLLLLPNLFKLTEPDLDSIAIAHLGTLAAVLIYFWRDLREIGLSLYSGVRQRRIMSTKMSRLGWFIIVGSIPSAVAGLLLEDLVDQVLATPKTAAGLLIITGLVLIFGERTLTGHKKLSSMRWADAIIIGFAQVLALLPGISRSGATISAGLSRGIDRPAAARFSFLLGVPAIAGAGLLSLLDLVKSPGASDQLLLLLATLISASLVGFLCIHFLLSWLRQKSLYPFAVYCMVFGAFYLLAG